MGLVTGVTALNNTSKNIEFTLGVQYEADLKIGVLIDGDYIFKSETPISYSPYINSISGDIMKLNESALTFVNDKLTLTFENFHSDIKIQVIVNGDTDKKVIVNEEAKNTYEITKSTTGTTLINLVFEELQLFTVTFNMNGGNEANTTAQYFDGEICTIPNPTRDDGYIFGGWVTDVSKPNTVEGPKNGEALKLTGDTTLYALWGNEVMIGLFGFVEDDLEYMRGYLNLDTGEIFYNDDEYNQMGLMFIQEGYYYPAAFATLSDNIYSRVLTYKDEANYALKISGTYLDANVVYSKVYDDGSRREYIVNSGAISFVGLYGIRLWCAAD